MADAAETPPHVAQAVLTTLSYSMEEDRICLGTKCADGTTTKLWLTARLVQNLISYLTRKDAELRVSEFWASRAEASANAAEAGVDPVVCDPDSPELLVSSVDITTVKCQTVLTFRDAADSRRTVFSLSPSGLTEWNKGLKKCINESGWLNARFERGAGDDGGLASHRDTITVH